jgi:hypothetical protein
MDVLNINGQKAIRITGSVKKETKKAYLIDCDGDREWFPRSAVRINDDGTVDIQEWIYKLKFPKG